MFTVPLITRASSGFSGCVWCEAEIMKKINTNPNSAEFSPVHRFASEPQILSECISVEYFYSRTEQKEN